MASLPEAPAQIFHLCIGGFDSIFFAEAPPLHADERSQIGARRFGREPANRQARDRGRGLKAVRGADQQRVAPLLGQAGGRKRRCQVRRGLLNELETQQPVACRKHGA